MAFYSLEKLHQLYDGYQRAFQVERLSLLLIQDHQGRRYLILNECPHQSAPMDRGTISQGYLRCPIHGIEFDLETGRAKAGCAATLQFLPLSYEGNAIGVVL